MASRESSVRRDLSVLDGEAWSWRRHADVCLLPRCGNFRSLKRFVAMTAAALDEGRSGNLQRQNATLHHIYAVLEPASQDPSHETEWGWPLLGIQDPEGRLLPLGLRAECRGGPPQGARRLGCSAQEHWETLHRQLPRQARRLPPTSRERREIQAEFGRRNAKGGKGTGGKKGAQGIFDQVRQGPARASSGASPARLLKEPVSGRLGWVFLPFVLNNWGKKSPFASACHERACPVLSWTSDPDSQQQVLPTSATFRSQKRH